MAEMEGETNRESIVIAYYCLWHIASNVSCA